MTYSAMSVAKHIISYCYRENYPISNLKLQCILYRTWIDYYKETHQPLYNDDICARRFGPGIPEVYYEFCIFAGTPICREYPSELSESDSNILERIVNPYMKESLYDLVNYGQKQGGPWDRIYRNGDGFRSVIPFSLIKKLECGN